MTLKRLIDYNVERRTLQIPAGQNPQTVECLVNPDPCCGVSPGAPPAEVTAYPCNPAGPTRRKVLGLKVERTIIPSLWVTKSTASCTTNPFNCCGGTDPRVTAGNGPVRGLTLEQTPLKTPAAGAYGSPSCSIPTNCCPPVPCPFPSGIPQFLTATLHRNINIDVKNSGSCASDPTFGTHWRGYIEGGPAPMVNIGGYKWRTDFNDGSLGSASGASPGEFDFEGVNGHGGLYNPVNKQEPFWPCVAIDPQGVFPPGYQVNGLWVEVWFGDPPPYISPGGNYIASFQPNSSSPIIGGITQPGYWMWDDVDQKSVQVPAPQGWWFGLHLLADRTLFPGLAVSTPGFAESGFIYPVVYSMFRWPENFAQCVFLDNTNRTGGCPTINGGLVANCGQTVFGSGSNLGHTGGNDLFPCDPNYINCSPLFGSFGWDAGFSSGTPTAVFATFHQNLLVGQ